MRIIGLAEDESLILGRNLRSVSLWSLYQKLPEGMDLEALESVDELPRILPRLKEFVRVGVERLSVSIEDLFSQPGEVSH